MNPTPNAGSDAGLNASIAQALREAASAVEDDCDHSKAPCFCGSAEWLRQRADAIEFPGCDCTDLCEMGPTCPGGTLAKLPGSGCHRTDGAS